MRSGLCSAPRTAPTLLAIAIALGSASPVAAALYGHRSQELSDGTGGLVTPGSAFANDGLGRAVAVGDWNGDGYDDLAVAEMESLLGQNEGAVRILYSTSAGLLGAGALPPQLIYDFIPETGALDREAFDDFGSALAAGNFDCDAYDDLVIAIPGENIGAAADAGAVLVLQGSPAGLVTANLLDFEPQRFYQGLASVGDAAETGDRFGAALAVGNFDGNSGHDLAIGVPGENAAQGAVAVLYSASGCPGLGLMQPQHFDQDSPGMLDAGEAGDAFGYELAAGDFAGDVADDLAIGVFGEDVEGQTDAGAVQVVYGLPISGLDPANNQFWHENLADAGGFTETSDHFGEVLAAGDLDGDFIDELAIGAPAEDVSFHPDAGAVTVLRGASALGLTSDSATHFDQSGVGDGETLGDFDNFGYSLRIGDFVDGSSAGNDLAIGIPQESVGSPTPFPFVGAVTVIPGGGGTLEIGAATLWSKGYFGSAGTQVDSPEYYGYALAAGDFDGTGHADLAIGAVQVEGIHPGGGPVTSGAVYVLYGALFSDGFENDNVSRWSASTGCASCLAAPR